MKNIQLPGEWLVIGPGSLVGSRFVELVQDYSIVYGAGGKNDLRDGLKSFYPLDITDTQEVEKVITTFPGQYIINFAGATIVDEIEKNRPEDPNNQVQLDQNIAYRVNVLGTRNLIGACKKTGKLPIFISTGFVFDGEHGPYSEEDAIASASNDVSWYGWTKILAEMEAAGSGINYLMIRISYPYRSRFEAKSDFARNFLKLYDEVKSGVRESFYPIFADQILTPTFIDDLPEAVNTLISRGAKGIYHVTSSEITTPYQFCCELLKVARGVENPELIVPIGSLVEFQRNNPQLAKRPLKGGEKTDKIAPLGFVPTSWQEGIEKAFGKDKS